MATGTVFKDLYANEVRIANNTTNVTTPNLKITNLGSGDAVMQFSGGAAIYSMGIDNSNSDIFVITPSTSLGAALFAANPTTLATSIGQTPTGDAKLALSSTTQGFLTCRMTAAQMQAITTPTEGLLVYNTTSGALYVMGAAQWEKVTSDPAG